MKLVFEDKKRVNEDISIKLRTGEVIRMTDKQSDWADRIIYYLDLGDDEDAMTEVQKDFAEGKASKYLDKLDGKAPRRTIDAFKSFLGHESKKRMNEDYDHLLNHFGISRREIGLSVDENGDLVVVADFTASPKKLKEYAYVLDALANEYSK